MSSYLRLQLLLHKRLPRVARLHMLHGHASTPIEAATTIDAAALRTRRRMLLRLHDLQRLQVLQLLLQLPGPLRERVHGGR